MLLKLKDKQTLLIDEFSFKCATGRNGIKNKKEEGDGITPRGIFSIGELYYRADKVKKPSTKLNIKKIKKNIVWCDDPKSYNYNKETKINFLEKHEKLFRKDNSYDYLIVVNFNHKKIVPNKGSAIFIHLTKSYKPTAGCIALKKKDFLILCKLINKNTKIKIF